MYSVSDMRERRIQRQSLLKGSLSGLFVVSSEEGKDCRQIHSQVLSEETVLCFQLLFVTVHWLQEHVIPSGLLTSK